MKHPDILSLIDEKLDQKIRNVKIRTVWNVLKSLTKKGLVRFGYSTRIQHLMDQFHLSYSRIEAIIKEEEE